jgi:hypothetical protein
MNSTFIRVLWGDEGVERHAKVLDEFAVRQKDLIQPSPLTVYAYGRRNYEALVGMGYSPVLLSEEPVVNWSTSNIRNVREDHWGRLCFGWSMWRHKIDASETALRSYDEVVFLDADVRQEKPLPPDFWDVMRRGQPVQAFLLRYHTKKRHAANACPWRSKDTNISCDAGFMYFRGLPIIQHILRLYCRQPKWTEQAVISFLIDKMMRGWKGAEAYRAAGFLPYCFQTYTASLRVFPAQEVIFQQGRGRKSDPYWQPPEDIV